MVKVIDRLQVIFKVAERCNLACSYCYYFFGDDDSFKERPPKMPVKTVKEFTKFIKNSLSETKINHLEISFHGGEPLLLGTERFSSYCNHILNELGNKTNISFVVQTNCTLITDSWIDVFEKFNVRVGISIDGPKNYNDKFRIDHKGKGSYDRIKEGIGLLSKAAERKKISPISAITVINGEYDYRVIAKHLHEDLGIKSLSFLYPDMCHDDSFPGSTSIKDYSKAVTDIFSYWQETRDLSVRQIDSALYFFQDKEVGNHKDFEEYENYTRLQNQIIVIHSNGEISIDDSLMPTKGWRIGAPNYTLKEATLSDFVNSEHSIFIRESQSKISNDCKDCGFSKICKGGDLENRYSQDKVFDNKSVFCESLFQFYSNTIRFLIRNGYPKDKIGSKLNVN